MAFSPKTHNPYSKSVGKKHNPTYHQSRKNKSQRGYTYKWDKASIQYRKDNPLCVSCESNSIVKDSEVVDHITPHKGDMELFWNIDNWQALCKRCHDMKTAQEKREFNSQ